MDYINLLGSDFIGVVLSPLKVLFMSKPDLVKLVKEAAKEYSLTYSPFAEAFGLKMASGVTMLEGDLAISIRLQGPLPPKDKQDELLTKLPLEYEHKKEIYPVDIAYSGVNRTG